MAGVTEAHIQKVLSDLIQRICTRIPPPPVRRGAPAGPRAAPGACCAGVADLPLPAGACSRAGEKWGDSGPSHQPLPACLPACLPAASAGLLSPPSLPRSTPSLVCPQRLVIRLCLLNRGPRLGSPELCLP